MTIAPIALFTYNRPKHTRLTVEALRANHLSSESDLFVFSDAPRSGQQYDMVQEVRDYIRGIDGFKSVTIIEREKNFGLARSIIDGVTRLIREYGSVIVLEDDLETSPHFLRYMNDALERYRDVERVISIHAYVYPVVGRLPEVFFLRGADCWGWATWQRGWALFEPDGAKLLAELRQRRLERAFDFDGSYPCTAMLESQTRGGNDSWAIRWHASAFLRDRLTLYPGRSLVQNIGNDGSGTHSGTTNHYNTYLSDKPVSVHQLIIEENNEIRFLIRNYFKSIRTKFWQKLCKSIDKRIQRLSRYFCSVIST